MRKLATIRQIKNILPIENADNLELAIIDGWKVVINKGKHFIGEKIVYFEIDSLLPIRDEFEFLRKSSYIKMQDGTDGFRLRTIKLRGQISQGLVMPLSILPSMEYNIGDDVTEILNVKKYEPPIPLNLAGEIVGMFPTFIQKTDEERIQNFADEYEEFKKYKYFVTEKLDGTSFTCYFKGGNFGVCSINLELKKDEKQIHWKIAIENDLENKLKEYGKNIAIQGEIIGEKIQKNIYGIKGVQLYVFNVFDIDNYAYLSKKECVKLVNDFELLNVPIIYENVEIPNTIEDILKMAEGNSMLKNIEREGLVWVANDSPQRISFKSINNKYLLKND
jgi:RNA ligase (TIGR02306 family)